MKRDGHTRAVGDRIRVKKDAHVYGQHLRFVGKKGTVVRLAPGYSRSPLIVVRFARQGWPRWLRLTRKSGSIELAFFEDEVELVSSDDSTSEQGG